MTLINGNPPLRKCYTNEFGAFEASLKADGTDMAITMANLEQCLLTFAQDSSHLVPVLLSYTVLQCSDGNGASMFLGKTKATIIIYKMYINNIIFYFE